MPLNVSDLLAMNQNQLDELFNKGKSDPIPSGEGTGTAIIAPGTLFNEPIAHIVSLFAWQGKTFDSAHGVLTNRILPFGLNAIIADVYKAPSLYDGAESIVLDYSKTSTVAHWIRDEIRLIQPGWYLGLVYWDNVRLIHFALQFPAA